MLEEQKKHGSEAEVGDAGGHNSAGAAHSVEGL